MRRLREKLHSERGASILLAMLLFLVCCMVAASVLAAAASNAGKNRSNRAEQQKYLTLSSAIRFVADEIEKAEYTWRYKVYEWEVTAGGSTEQYFFCEQEEGTVSGGDLFPTPAGGTEVLPLKKPLDEGLRKLFLTEGYGALTSVPGLITDDKSTCDLLVTLPSDLDGYPYEEAASPVNMKAYQISEKVTVRVELNHTTHHIRLTAWLGEGDDPPTDNIGTMVAELVSEGTASQAYNNPGRTAGKKNDGTGDANILPDPYPAADEIIDVSGKTVSMTAPANKEETIKWKLNWIRKGGS